jgi:integrase/recombinase XerD
LRRAQVSLPRAGSHVFLHGFATRLLQHGQSLKTIADLLGHRHISSTQVYIRATTELLEQANQRFAAHFRHNICPNGD